MTIKTPAVEEEKEEEKEEEEVKKMEKEDEKGFGASLGFGAALDDMEGEVDDDLSYEKTPEGSLNEQVRELMKDNLEIMRDIVFRIREDPKFASSIYADCPRLQLLLEENPDLRPIFEDPKLVRINFEKVYRDNGGVLPEDEEDEPGPLRKAYRDVMAKVNELKESRLFKIFKVFQALKKIMGFLSPSKGISAIKGACKSMFNMDDVEGDAEGEMEGNPANREAKAQLNKAADHMEDPEVQENMQKMLDDPDSMQDAIEDDPALRQLRDDNPLCAEMMNDPEHMKVLTNPDNLRALGECPDLIEQDFASPDFSPPEGMGDLEAPEMEAPEVEAPEAEIEGEVEGEVEGEEGELEGEEEEEEQGLMDQVQEQKDLNDEEGGGDDGGDKDKSKGPKDKKKDKKKEEKNANADASNEEAKGFFKAGLQVVGGQLFGDFNPLADAEELDLGGDLDGGDLDGGDLGGGDAGLGDVGAGDAGGLTDAAGGADPSSLTDAAGDTEMPEPDAETMAGAGAGALAAAAAAAGGDEEGGGGMFADMQERFAVDQEGLMETAQEQGQETMAARAEEGGGDGSRSAGGKRGPGEEEQKKKGFGIGGFISGVAGSVMQDTFIGGVVDEDHMGYVEGFQEAMDEQDEEAEAAAKEKGQGSRAIGEDGEEVEVEEESGGRFGFLSKAANAVTAVIQDELIGNVATEIVGEDNVDDFLGEVEGIQEETAAEEDGGGDGEGGDKEAEEDAGGDPDTKAAGDKGDGNGEDGNGEGKGDAAGNGTEAGEGDAAGNGDGQG